MASIPIVVELGSVRVYRGKYEFHTKPTASALGVTKASHRSPIRILLTSLLDEGKITSDDSVNVMRGPMPIFKTRTVAEWLDGRATGTQPGSRPWLRKKSKEEDNDDE